jgi:CRP/FNR family transcriptional regulator
LCSKLKEKRLKASMVFSGGNANKNNLLGDLPPGLPEALLGRRRRVCLSQGEVLFEQGDDGNGCYWLQQGVVTVSASLANAQRRIIALLGPGAVIGELAMIDGQPRSATVQAITDCVLSFVSRASFEGELSDHPELYSHIMLTLAARLRQSDEDRVAATSVTVEARLARALLSVARHLGEDGGPGRIRILHQITQLDLAAMAGISRESVGTALAAWERQDIVRGSAREGYVIDDARLRLEAATK